MFDTAEYNDHQGGEIRKRHAFLVGVRFPGDSRFEARMEELRGLTEACGAEVRGMADQKLPREDSAYFIGKGKVEEIRLTADSLHADLVIFNNTLSPSQLTNLSEALELEVIDRYKGDFVSAVFILLCAVTIVSAQSDVLCAFFAPFLQFASQITAVRGLLLFIRK